MAFLLLHNYTDFIVLLSKNQFVLYHYNIFHVKSIYICKIDFKNLKLIFNYNIKIEKKL